MNNNGPSGTCAEAVEDPTQTTTIYQGGQNNSSTPGVRKSVDGGMHWNYAVTGLTDHSIRALRLDPGASTTIYAGTPSGVFRSTDGATTWAFESTTGSYGDVRRLLATSVAGTSTLVAATGRGLGYRSFATSGTWSMSAAPTGGVYDVVVASAPAGGPTVLYAALDNGKVYKVSLATSGVTWGTTAMAANTLTVDPSNAMHILATVYPGSAAGGADYSVSESTDGGATVHNLSGGQVFYVAFDPRDTTGKTVWTGAESGVGHSTDGGKTFSSVPWNIKSKDGYNTNNAGIDVQRILADFPGTGPAFCSDQGLTQYDPTSKSLLSLSGDIKDAIVTSVAASRVNASTLHVLTTMWDWGPTESWDGGQSWQATSWYGAPYWNAVGGKGAPSMGEGGQVFAVPTSADGKTHVLMHDGAQGIFLSSDGGSNFTSISLASSLTIQYDGFDWARDASGNASGTFYLITSTSIQRSTDYGMTWAAWGPSGTANVIATDPKNANHIFLTSGSCLKSTTDGGTTWSACTTPSPKKGNIKRLVVRPDDSTKLLALTTSGEVLQSSDSGSTWKAVTASNITSAVTTGSASAALLSYSPDGKLAVVVATTTARPVVTPHVLSSADDGTTWTDITNDIVSTQFNNATWDGTDFYLASSGEAILRRKALSP